MDWSWLWQALFSQVVWELLGILGVGGLLTYLKSKRAALAPHVQTFLVGAACAAILLFTITGKGIMSKPVTSRGNVERNIRDWMDKNHIALQKVDDDKSLFSYEITAMNGGKFFVYRDKEREGSVIFEGRYEPTTLKKELDSMSAGDKRLLATLISLELSKTKVSFVVDPQSLNMESFIETPIDENLTEEVFLSNLKDINNAFVVGRNSLAYEVNLRDLKQHFGLLP